MASTTRVSAAAERRRAGNLLQASVADGMGFSNHATIVAHPNGRNSPAGVRIGSPLFTHILFGVYVAVLMWADSYSAGRRCWELCWDDAEW